MRSCQLENFIAFLVRNQAERQFRHRMTGDDCLRSLPLISSTDSVDLGSGTRPDTLQRGDWILDRASKNAGMQIHLRPSNLDLEGGHSTQTIAECWHPSLNHSGIGDHCYVAFECIAIFLQKTAQMCAANFLL